MGNTGDDGDDGDSRLSSLLRPRRSHSGGRLAQAGPVSPRLPSSPILVHPLPSSSTLAKESLAQSELELDKQTQDRRREQALAEALQEQQWQVERAAARNPSSATAKPGAAAQGSQAREWGTTARFERPPQAYELYKAIDQRDVDFIMRVRDHAFNLLLQKHGGEFPIVYAARQGERHRHVVVLLVGALSRYVNHLEPQDFDNKETRGTLRMLRSNLKLAIDHALMPAASSPALLSSYLQVLIMSEGDVLLHQTISDLVILLRAPSAEPVAAAEKVIRSFCTKELRGVPGGVADVEDYVANATLDLVIMSIWSFAAGQVGLDRLPTYTFARDTRTWTVFKEATEENRLALGKVNGRGRSLIKVILDYGGDAKKSVQGRVKSVAGVLDRRA